MPLEEYRRKRHFAKTPEPEGTTPARPAAKTKGARKQKALSFVIQKHAASRLHYDFRLEHGGVLLSWAVPKGPSLDPSDKRLAVHVEDHPLAYAGFEGVIPQGEYGGGSVIVWDRGTWEPEGDVAAMLKAGRLRFRLDGEKLSGAWNLVRTGGRMGGEKNWLLIKSKDEAVRPRSEFDLLEERPESVLSGRTVEAVGESPGHVWKGGKAVKAKAADKKASTKKPNAPKRAKSAKPRSVGRRLRPAEIHGAITAPMPDIVEPQLARDVPAAPEGEGWVHEIKFDGYRLLCRLNNERAKIITRGGHDWTGRFPEVAAAVEDLPAREAWLDGEAVAPGPDGIGSFSALQDALSRKETAGLIYFAFDLLYLDGRDLRPAPLIERKAALRDLLKGARSSRVQYVDHIEASGSAVRDAACEQSLEGIICKRAQDPYRPGRTGSWLKAKCAQGGEFVVGGFTGPKGSRRGFGSLLLGEFDADGHLVYAGRVGTGFDEQLLVDLRQRLDRLTVKGCPFSDPPAEAKHGRPTWVRPQLVVETAYAERTADGLLRQARFRGLREDKLASEVRIDMGATKATSSKTKPQSKSRRKLASRAATTAPLSDDALAQLASVRLTSPEKVLDPKSGLTKLELAGYYAAVADWILPHVAGRPLSLVRCPDGTGAQCFFQKHADRGTSDAIKRLPIEGEEKDHLVIRDLAGLAALVQMGVLEIHVWGSRDDRPDRADRLIFDLDPGEGVRWADVIDAALLVRDRLAALGLTTFPKTTGGKGLHVVAPMDRRHTWDEVKAFAKRFAERLAGEAPHRFLSKSSKAARKGKIYVDYLRNATGATAIAPYSPRARDGAPVAVPVFWEEITPKLKPAAFDVRSVPERLASLDSDPWADIDDVRQSLTKAKKALGV